MPTTRIAGTEKSRYDTGDTLGSYRIACADVAENFFYFFRNDGALYKTDLPDLAAQNILVTLANFSDMRCIVAHPTDANLLVYFNATDGVKTVHTGTGVLTQLLSAAAFDALLNVGELTISILTSAKIRGTNLLLHSDNDPSGSIWQYNVNAGTATRLLAMNCLSAAADLGPDATNELMLTGYGSPSYILFRYDLPKDQIRVVAGTGAEGLDAGDALTEATFFSMTGIFRMASDLYYANNGNMTRWIQGGQVGNYPNFLPRFIACVLPGRNLVVEVEAHDVIVWE